MSILRTCHGQLAQNDGLVDDYCDGVEELHGIGLVWDGMADGVAAVCQQMRVAVHMGVWENRSE